MQDDAIKRLQEFAEKNKQTQGKFTIGDEKVRQLCQRNDHVLTRLLLSICLVYFVSAIASGSVSSAHAAFMASSKGLFSGFRIFIRAHFHDYIYASGADADTPLTET